MAKEYIVEKAFQPKDENDKPKSWSSKEGGEMFVWKVRVEGEDFWFDLNKKPGNVITPGDTIYGLFDEETVTPKDKTKEPFTVKKFVKVKRPDGSYDKVQARQSSGGDSPSTQTSSGPDARTEARILRLENQLGLPPIEWTSEVETKEEDNKEQEPLKAEDLPL